MEKAVLLARGLGRRMREPAQGDVPGLPPGQAAVAASGVQALMPIGQPPFLHSCPSALAAPGPYPAQRENRALDVVVEGDVVLFNVYHVMQVNPAKSRQINAEAAAAFVEFVTSREAQDTIRDFGVERFGQPLFVPDVYVESTPGAQTAP